MSRLSCLFLIFWIGCLALIYEIYSMRALFMFYVENTKAASIAISAFLGGLAFSSILFGKLPYSMQNIYRKFKYTRKLKNET